MKKERQRSSKKFNREDTWMGSLTVSDSQGGNTVLGNSRDPRNNLACLSSPWCVCLALRFLSFGDKVTKFFGRYFKVRYKRKCPSEKDHIG